ncbi:MAG: S26 family signal peptidase [Planctomycetaceae bacterium]|jgi:signal peptidase I|nr:S26 family signal peptidase [Planctomycetaceae bacterium]
MNTKKPKRENKTTQPAPEKVNGVRTVREFVDSLVFALLLAFLLKAFVAEAYLIPTGSMASTLMGLHKDISCEMCGYRFQVNASEEAADQFAPMVDHNGNPIPLPRVVGGTCPQCRHSMYLGDDNVDRKNYAAFNGDRIFVSKCQFDFFNPRRWHVTVFRYPGKPQINYIKRLIGIENETVRIEHGDIFVCRHDDTNFKIQRKPLPQLLAMLRIVDDNDYVLSELHDVGWFDKWSNSAAGKWKRSADFKSFSIDTNELDSDDTEHWLEYSNIVPTSDDWLALRQQRLPKESQTKTNPQLVTDFIGYNSGIVRYPNGYSSISSDSEILSLETMRDGKTRREHFCRQNPYGMGLNWVGDLAVSANLKVQKAEGVFAMSLVKGGVTFRCDIELDTGNAAVSIVDREDLFEPATAKTNINSKGSHEIMFCNIDEELRLIIDGREIDFGGKNCYDKLCGGGKNTPLNRNRKPTLRDLKPAGIGVKGAAVEIEHVKVWRDMYYIACNEDNKSHCDLLVSPFNFFRNAYTADEIERSVNRFFANPEYWETLGRTRAVEFRLESGQFLMLGDNSAKSKDSRLWTEDHIPHYVERDMLIGEAMFVYWPHGLRVFGTRIALIPNFKKMRRIY